MRDVFLCDAARTAIGRYGGALAKVRTDDLAAIPIRAVMVLMFILSLLLEAVIWDGARAGNRRQGQYPTVGDIVASESHRTLTRAGAPI